MPQHTFQRFKEGTTVPVLKGYIRLASYGDHDNRLGKGVVARDVKIRVQELIDAGKPWRCDNRTLGSDPAPGVPKTLNLSISQVPGYQPTGAMVLGLDGLEKFAWHDEGKSHWTAKQIHDKYQTGVKLDFGRFPRDASFDNFPIGHKFRVCKDPWSLKSHLEEDRKRHKGEEREVNGLFGQRFYNLCTHPWVGAAHPKAKKYATGDPNDPKNIPVFDHFWGLSPSRGPENGGMYCTLASVHGGQWRDIWGTVVTVKGHYKLTPKGVPFLDVTTDEVKRMFWHGETAKKCYGYPARIPAGCILLPFDETTVGKRVNGVLDEAVRYGLMNASQRKEIQSKIYNGARPQGFENDYERKIKKAKAEGKEPISVPKPAPKKASLGEAKRVSTGGGGDAGGDPSTWKPEQMAKFVTSLGPPVAQYAKAFLENGYDGPMLKMSVGAASELDGDFEDMGISSRLHRKKLVANLTQLMQRLST